MNSTPADSQDLAASSPRPGEVHSNSQTRALGADCLAAKEVLRPAVLPRPPLHPPGGAPQMPTEVQVLKAKGFSRERRAGGNRGSQSGMVK
ncbi:hypothetical protein EYF80_025583 [Liparis tanakae]|uniref:Uncharacterized protein n=1 Tax=Liparis tanakae TaxID=230148 RepID=A0A4Z2HG56_9TELE|nr:hypothetical protein EYF80_025583 [Liparis tanakae]